MAIPFGTVFLWRVHIHRTRLRRNVPNNLERLGRLHSSSLVSCIIFSLFTTSSMSANPSKSTRLEFHSSRYLCRPTRPCCTENTPQYMGDTCVQNWHRRMGDCCNIPSSRRMQILLEPPAYPMVACSSVPGHRFHRRVDMSGDLRRALPVSHAAEAHNARRRSQLADPERRVPKDQPIAYTAPLSVPIFRRPRVWPLPASAHRCSWPSHPPGEVTRCPCRRAPAFLARPVSRRILTMLKPRRSSSWIVASVERISCWSPCFYRVVRESLGNASCEERSDSEAKVSASHGTPNVLDSVQ